MLKRSLIKECEKLEVHADNSNEEVTSKFQRVNKEWEERCLVHTLFGAVALTEEQWVSGSGQSNQQGKGKSTRQLAPNCQYCACGAKQRESAETTEIKNSNCTV